MVSPKELLSNISVLAPNTPSPTQRINLINSIRRARSSLQSLLTFPPPKASDRAQVQSREVRLPDSGPISLDEQDVKIALKLSDDLHLNEIDCVQLLVSAKQEWNFLGREPLDILRLTAGLWYTGRRDLLTALYSLLRAVVLEPGLDDDLVADIQKYLEDLLNSGLRQRLISLIKELNREEAAGLGGPNCEPYIIDSRGALVERRAVVCRERLLLGHCLILSVLVVRASSKDLEDLFSVLKDTTTDLFSVLKDTTTELDGSNDILKYQAKGQATEETQKTQWKSFGQAKEAVLNGNPMPWNSITLRLSFSNSINSPPNNEIQGYAISRFCGGNFTIQELSIATRCFSQVNLLGESEFGSVHKGVLSNGRRIAVKGLKTDSRQRMQEVFLQEVEIISRVHHKHLVSLIGYCISSAKRLLVYEFLPNSNLDFHLHGKDQPVMKWASRMRIAIGAAKGLAHLHEECEPSIVHLNIKASNILLDSNFEAKVADFGFAKTLRRTNNDGDATANDLMPNEISREAGYFGYLAPEYATSRRASAKADVFSYGVILLELITGWKPLSKRDPLTTDFLVPLAQPLLTYSLELNDFTGLADPRLQLNYNTEEMAKMVACAAACICKLESRRPPMSEIILVLEGDMPWSDLLEGTLPVKDSSSGISATQSGSN